MSPADHPGTLAGKVAIVTGGASGIGRATALAFAAHGARVTVADRNELAGRQVAQAIVDEGGTAIAVEADVTEEPACRRVVECTVEAFGRLDVLFNNAGVIRRATVLETSDTDWDHVMAVNVKGVFLMSKHAIPAMTSGGAIVNTGSGWGLVGGARAAAYCASKGAVVQLTRAMALDHGPQRIRVNCVCPGDTDTPLLTREAQQLGADVERFLEQAAERPLGRVGTPEDIATAVVYLASDASAFVTGTTLVVDGGGLAGTS